MIDLTDLQQEVHTLAREKGWYDDRDLTDPDVREAMLCLIHSEVSEALECVRRGEMALAYEIHDDQGTCQTFRAKRQCAADEKPVGFPSELADVVLRCLDYAAAFGVNLVQDEVHAIDLSTPIKIAARLHSLHDELASYGVGCVPADCFGIAQALGFNLLEVIRIKHEYNKTRPRRHGGKAL